MKTQKSNFTELNELFSDDERLNRQIQFLAEIDQLKKIYRQTYLTDKSRQENDAEHSWHLAMYLMILNEQSTARHLDLLKVLKMGLIHDLVEIDAGDTYIYQDINQNIKFAKEKAAAERIFSILPDDQAAELMNLWLEFEKRESPEACFCAACDRLQPLIHNYLTSGKSWKKHNIRQGMVKEKMQTVKVFSRCLWDYVVKIIEHSVKKKYLKG